MIPVWVLHVLITAIFIFFLISWAWRNDKGGYFDFSAIFALIKTLVCALVYAGYWIVFLIFLVNKKT